MTFPLAAESGIGALGFNGGAFIWQFIAFVVFLFLFLRLVYRPLIRTLDQRVAEQRQIQESSERIKRELTDATAASDRARLEGQQQAQQIIAQAKTQAERSIAEAQDRAQTEYNARVERAQGDIEAQRTAAIADLRRTFADLTISAATKVVRQELNTDPNKQRQLINETLQGSVFSGGTTTPTNNGQATR